MNSTKVRADHPNERPNFVVVEIGDIRLSFSYNTCIAYFAPGEGLVVSENVWGPTTGRHISMVSDHRSDARLNRIEFERRLADVMTRLTFEPRPTIREIRHEFLEVMQA